MAIANPVRHDDFFRRYLSNVALIDLRVSAVTFNIDLGRNWRRTSTYFLENITLICLSTILGIAGSNAVRREFRFQRAGWVDAADCLSVDCQTTGLQPIGRFAIGLKCPLKLPQPTAKVGPSYAKLSELMANSAHAAAIASTTRRWMALDLSLGETISVIAISRIEHPKQRSGNEQRTGRGHSNRLVFAQVLVVPHESKNLKLVTLACTAVLKAGTSLWPAPAIEQFRSSIVLF